MKSFRIGALLAAILVFAPAHAEPLAPVGPAIKRLANMPDGAPAFEIVDVRGIRVSRIECIHNGWYESDEMAARLLVSPEVMARIIAKGGHIVLEDLGPAYFDCVVVTIIAPKSL